MQKYFKNENWFIIAYEKHLLNRTVGRISNNDEYSQKSVYASKNINDIFIKDIN